MIELKARYNIIYIKYGLIRKVSWKNKGSYMREG